MKTFEQQMADIGLEFTARDVLDDDELAEDWRLRHKSPDRPAVRVADDSEPPWF